MNDHSENTDIEVVAIDLAKKQPDFRKRWGSCKATIPLAIFVIELPKKGCGQTAFSRLLRAADAVFSGKAAFLGYYQIALHGYAPPYGTGFSSRNSSVVPEASETAGKSSGARA